MIALSDAHGAAIVAGLLGGVVVLVGVVLAEVLLRSRERRRRLEDHVHALTVTVGRATLYLSDQTPHEVMDLGEVGYQALQEVLEDLFAVDQLTRGSRRRYKKDLHEAADDLGARLMAASLRHANRQPLTLDETLEISASELARIMFGDRPTVDDQIKAYLKNGFGRTP